VKRIIILAVAAVMLAVAAAPAMAQNDKAAQRAANKAAKQEQRAQNRAAKGAGSVQKAAPAQGGAVPDEAFAQKALPSSGGMPAGSVALLGTGVLLVGGGLVARRMVR
jgi:type II secretory pathway pseudopilin PulG